MSYYIYNLKYLIQVRRPDMYVDAYWITVDPEIGFIPKISGYTERSSY